MDFFKRDYLDILLSEREGTHISLFMQFDREADKWDANRIRLKNLLKEAKLLWGEQGGSFPEHELRLLVPDEADLMAAATTVGRPGRGLAIFWTADFSIAYYLPYQPGEQVVLGHRFTLRPLLPLLEEKGDFHLLTLSIKQVQLWQGDRYQLVEIKVPGMPAGMEAALELEDPERQLQFHTASGSGESRPAMFFGHDADTEKKGAIRRYLRDVARVVDEYLREAQKPLVTAGVGYLRPMYAEMSAFPYLLEEGITGNPEHRKAEDMQQKAWEIARPTLDREKKEALSQLVARQHTDQVAQTLEEIVPAATYGRVKALFALPDSNGRELRSWHQHRNTTDNRPLTEMKIATKEEYIDEAIMQTLCHNGSVYLLDREVIAMDTAGIDFPAALLRYYHSSD